MKIQKLVIISISLKLENNIEPAPSLKFGILCRKTLQGKPTFDSLFSLWLFQIRGYLFQR